MGTIRKRGKKLIVELDVSEVIVAPFFMYVNEEMTKVDTIGNGISRHAWNMVAKKRAELLEGKDVCKISGEGKIVIEYTEEL